LKEYSEIDSKFRYIILASKRAKQLLKGAKPKVKSKSRNLIRVAQQEVMQGLVEFEIIQNQVEEFTDTGDDMFIGEEIQAAVAADVVETAEADEEPKKPVAEPDATGEKIKKAAKAKEEKGEAKKVKKAAPKKKTKKE
jgi:DNA-directed RNA polymerase subunit K/omega